jgi:hypothetical protein
MARLYHLGCGDRRLDGYVNVDIRPTPATDLVADLNQLQLPGDEPAGGFFRHAFFEHLRRDSRVPHLIAVREELASDGFACYLGLPDFERIARLYVDRGPGVVGPTFDLFNVYRYTHGDPDRVPEAYLEQLHKSLFDADEVNLLLKQSGFPSYAIFSYVFPGEPVAVTLGFFATADRRSVAELERACRSYVSEFDGEFIDAGSIEFVAGETRAPLRASAYARATASGPRRAVSRVARAVAARLARV